MFFGTLKKFNDHVPFRKESMHKMEAYFNFYWEQNRNAALETDEDKEMLA